MVSRNPRRIFPRVAGRSSGNNILCGRILEWVVGSLGKITNLTIIPKMIFPSFQVVSKSYLENWKTLTLGIMPQPKIFTSP